MLRRLLADALIASGRRAESRGELERACRHYRAAAAVAPRYAPASLNLGAALEAAGEAAAAARAYATLLKAEPADPYANYNLGRLRHARGETAEAERLLRIALQGKPDFTDAGIALANVQEARGDLAGAAILSSPRWRCARAMAGAGPTMAASCGRWDGPTRPRAALRRALGLDPASVAAWLLLGNLLRGTSRLAEALDGFAKRLPDALQRMRAGSRRTSHAAP